MPYPKHLINEGETVALDLRPHWWFFSRHILTGIPLFIIVIVVLSNTDSGSFGGDSLRWIVGILFLVWAVWLGFKYLDWTYTYFVVTSDRVIYRTGVVSQHGVEIPLERINNINFHQRIFERMIGAGDLDIESAGEQGSRASTTCATPTSSSRRSTGRWRRTRARRPARLRRDRPGRPRLDGAGGYGRRRGGAEHPRADRAAGAAARPGPHHARGVRAKKAQLLERM